jgi:hypothetical protein
MCTPVANCHRYQRHRAPAANFVTGTAGVVDTAGEKFATGVNHTVGKFNFFVML